MKMRYFYKVDQKREPIPASNVRRKSKPSGKDWRELHNICCSPIDVPCTCGPRFWIKLDSTNKPVDFSLIKRSEKITPEPGLKYYEIPSSKNECCGEVVFTFSTEVEDSSFTIKKNGHTMYISDANFGGSFKFVEGDTIQTIINAGSSDAGNLAVTSTVDPGVDFTSSAVTPSITHTFVAHSGATYLVPASLSVTPTP